MESSLPPFTAARLDTACASNARTDRHVQIRKARAGERRDAIAEFRKGLIPKCSSESDVVAPLDTTQPQYIEFIYQVARFQVEVESETVQNITTIQESLQLIHAMQVDSNGLFDSGLVKLLLTHGLVVPSTPSPYCDRSPRGTPDTEEWRFIRLVMELLLRAFSNASYMRMKDFFQEFTPQFLHVWNTVVAPIQDEIVFEFFVKTWIRVYPYLTSHPSTEDLRTFLHLYVPTWKVYAIQRQIAMFLIVWLRALPLYNPSGITDDSTKYTESNPLGETVLLTELVSFLHLLLTSDYPDLHAIACTIIWEWTDVCENSVSAIWLESPGLCNALLSHAESPSSSIELYEISMQLLGRLFQCSTDEFVAAFVTKYPFIWQVFTASFWDHDSSLIQLGCWAFAYFISHSSLYVDHAEKLTILKRLFQVYTETPSLDVREGILAIHRAVATTHDVTAETVRRRFVIYYLPHLLKLALEAISVELTLAAYNYMRVVLSVDQTLTRELEEGGILNILEKNKNSNNDQIMNETNHLLDMYVAKDADID